MPVSTLHSAKKVLMEHSITGEEVGKQEVYLHNSQEELF
jgi:hypothetical protein